MSLKSRFDDADFKVRNAAIAQKIKRLMEDVRTEATDAAKKRWVWELLQNAKDVAKDNQGVSIQIVYDKAKKIIEFQHNGKPFTADDITFLINQQSTKDSERNSEHHNKKTGKFGIGFLMTHLLSEKVEVCGILEEGNEPSRKFCIPLDRSGREIDEISKSVQESIQSRDKLINDEEIDSKNYDEKAFNTIFRYVLNEEGIIVAENGLNDLYNLLPVTLVFVPKIRSVAIKHQNRVYKKLDNAKKLSENLKIFTISQTTYNAEIIETIKMAVVSQNSITIAIPIEEKDEKIFIKKIPSEKPTETPRLFCDFPLIGTEDFYFPVIINSADFNPTPSRDGIKLTESNDAIVKENKAIIQQAIELYYRLLDYASSQGWQNIYELAKTNLPKEKDWISMKWYKENVQKPMRDKLLHTPIVDHIQKGRIPIELGNNAFVDFPSAKTSELREIIWDICNLGDNFILPVKKDIHAWYEIIWDKKYRLDSHLLIDHVARCQNIKKLSETLLKKSEQEAVAWLNQFYAFLTLEETNLKLILEDQYAVVPNQNGIFKLKSQLSVDKGIDEELKNVIKILGNDYRDFLVLKEVATGKKISYSTKNQDNIIKEINNIIREDKNSNIETAVIYLLRCFADTSDFPIKREEIWNFTKAIFKNIPQDKKKIVQYEPSIWAECDQWIIKMIVKKISSQKNISGLTKLLNFDLKETPKWLDKFISFLIRSNWNNQLEQKQYPILPNQNGTFKVKDELFLDDEIDETLKDILKTLVKKPEEDYREFLLEKSIFLELPVNRTKTQQDIANDIVKHIKPLFAEVPRSEATKKIFSRLFLWFNENDEVAKLCFGDLYDNRHKFRADEDIIIDMKFKQQILNNRNGYSETEIIQIINTPNAREIFGDIEIYEIAKRLVDSPELKERVQQILQSDDDIIILKERNEKRKKLYKIGQEVEKVVLSVFLKEGFQIKKVEDGRDFELTLGGSYTKYSMEVKSTSTNYVLMYPSQARRAVNEQNQYALCVIEKDGNTNIDEVFIKQHAKFVITIGDQLKRKVELLEAFLKIEEGEYDFEIKLESDEDVKFRAAQKIWRRGKSFQEFVTYLKSSIFLKT